MQSTVAAFQLALVEAQQSQLRARHYEVRINTGQYKQRVGKVRHGINGHLFTPDELLQDEVATMNRHIQLAEEHLDYAKGLLADLKEEEAK